MPLFWRRKHQFKIFPVCKHINTVRSFEFVKIARKLCWLFFNLFFAFLFWFSFITNVTNSHVWKLYIVNDRSFNDTNDFPRFLCFHFLTFIFLLILFYSTYIINTKNIKEAKKLLIDIKFDLNKKLKL